MSKLNDKDKFEILEQEYSILFREVTDGYNTIQNRVSLLGATYAFIFSGFVAGISQWPDFRKLICLVVIEAVLLGLSFLLLIPAMFVTKFKKWESFGDPKSTIAKLNESETYEDYYLKKSKDWPNITKTNKKINSFLNTVLLINYFVLVISIFVIFFHIILTIMLNQ